MSSPQRRPAGGPSDPVLITDAARSYEDDLRARKRRYGLMMGMRIPCMILAAVFYQTPWIAVTLLVLSIPLPWMAVLIANDRMPRKREDVNRFRPDRTALEARPHPVVEPAPLTQTRIVDGEVVDGEVVGGTLLDRDGVARGEVYSDRVRPRDAHRAG